jgi:hypothetical protein
MGRLDRLVILQHVKPLDIWRQRILSAAFNDRRQRNLRAAIP